MLFPLLVSSPIPFLSYFCAHLLSLRAPTHTHTHMHISGLYLGSVWAEVLQGGIGAYAAGAGPFQGPGAAAGGTGRGWGHSQAGGGSGAGPVLSMDPDDMPFL